MPHDGNHEDVVDDHEGPPSEFEIMSRALQELFVEKGYVDAEQITKRMETFDDDYPYRGNRVIARAWADTAFKERLLTDANAACAEMGIVVAPAHLIALENTPEIHNLIVCTLCSCYPRILLGMPPTWYKSRNYRSRVVHEPRSVLEEFGTEISDHVSVRVHDSNADMRYVVIPMRPEGTEGWNESQLESLLTRDHLVGITVPLVSAKLK